MPPAKENDLLSSSFSTPLAVAPPQSSCPPTLQPLSSMYKLPVTVVPSNYDITVSFNIGERKYRGHVVTDIEILTPTRHVCVNSANLHISNIKVCRDEKATMGIISDSDSSIGVVRFDFGSTLNVGKYKLERSGFDGCHRSMTMAVVTSSAFSMWQHEWRRTQVSKIVGGAVLFVQRF